MALITLPNTAEWDDTKTLGEQSAEAQEYALGMEENATLREEEYCGDDLQSNAVNRITKRIYEDTPNNLKLEEVYEYVHASNHKACFAVKGRIYTLTETI